MKKTNILCVFANPANTISLGLKRENEIIREALNYYKNKNKIKFDVIEAATVQDLRRALLNENYHIVHFSTHGTDSGLLFEDDLGESYAVPQNALADLLKAYSTIECVILNACHSASLGKLIATGTAYTIAMENVLEDRAAIEFSRGFYDSIAAGKDYRFAYEQGRNNVDMTQPRARFPSVFRDAEFVTIDGPNSADSQLPPEPLKLGIPPRPEIFLGRDEDLGILKERLGLVKGGKDTGQTQILTSLRDPDGRKGKLTGLLGYPGIGKTAAATVLAEDAEITAAFPDGVLWASLGHSPNLIYMVARWAEELGTDEIYGVPGLSEVVERFAELIKNKKMLIVVDEVYEAEYAVPFKQLLGKDCGLLIGTRAPGVISDLSISREAVHNLRGLNETDSLRLLEILAPEVVADHREECRDLVRVLECVPLALHVAGRLLREEAREVWGVADLLKALREGKSIIEAKAPADRMDFENMTIPTVAALLRKSTDTLDPKVRRCFAYLAPLAEKPATFDLETLKAIWQLDDPKPIVRQLTSRGLLEPVGDRYQMHALQLSFASALLEELR